MAIRALDLMAKVSSRFVHEILPVATASVIGAMLVNHYGRQPASPPIVIQAQPSASEDAMVQSLREEHELIASFMKRNQEEGARRRAFGERRDAGRVGRRRPPFLSRIRRCPSHGRRRTESGRAARAKSRGQEKVRADGGAAASAGPSRDCVRDADRFWLLCRPRLSIEFEPRARPIIRVAGAMREWVADVAQAPGRVAFLPSLAGLVLDAAAHPAAELLPAELILKARYALSFQAFTNVCAARAEPPRRLRRAYRAPSRCRSRSRRRAGTEPMRSGVTPPTG